jgi:hypothetical protein
MTLRFHLIPVRMAIICNTYNNKCWWGFVENKNTYTMLIRMQSSAIPIESSIEFWQKSKNRNTIQPTNTIPGHMPKGCMQDRFWPFTHLIGSIIHNSQVCKQPRCPTTDESINNVVYIHSGELYSYEIIIFAGKWMQLENKMLRKLRQATKRSKLHIFSCM